MLRGLCFPINSSLLLAFSDTHSHKAWEGFCNDLGELPADVALVWLLVNPVVTALIIGPRAMEQLTGSLHTLKIKLNKDALKKIDGIWPGPGGEAPEAYAW